MTRNELDATFERLRRENRGALILYLTAGHPDPARFVDLAVTVLDAGADALEIGIPFSDPLLDGPSIQRSQQAALDAGITPAACLQIAEEIHRRNPKPLLFMGAYNPMLSFGLDRLCRAASPAGVTGVIVPDLPFEEQSDLLKAARENNIHVVEMAAPTSSSERMARVCSSASGFIYCISVAGVTGARSNVTDTARPLVERIRACTNLPVAVGFGIAGPEQASEVARFADGVIVGSALIDLVSVGGEDLLTRARAFTDGLCRALVRPAA